MNYKGWRIWLQGVNVNAAEPPWTRQRWDRQQSGGLRRPLGEGDFVQTQSCWKGLAEVLISASLAAAGDQLRIALLLHLLNISAILNR